MLKFPANCGYYGTLYTGLRNYTKSIGLYRYYKSLISGHLQSLRVDKAREIFSSIPSPDVSLYTMMVMGYARIGRLDDALKLFDEMPVRDTVSWNSMIKGCLDCGDLSRAKKVFDEMPQRSVVSWTTMIHGFMRFGDVRTAELLFREIPGKDVAAWNSMIHGYFSNSRVDEAIELFDGMPHRNVISWTSMISGLSQNGRSDEALIVFRRMMSLGFEPCSHMLVCAVTASANLLALHLGVEIHGLMVKLGHIFDEFASASLITLYANCQQIENARKVFEEKLHNNVAVWTALVTGYSSNFEPDSALEVFRDMIAFGVVPNQSSFTSALNSCCALEALDEGKAVHSGAIKLGFETDAYVGNALIVMYSQSGDINDGIRVFRKITEKNIVSWNSMIVGCAQHGRGLPVLSLFGSMICLGIEADEITFTGLLSACSHSGMVQKGRGFFDFFSRFKGFEMKREHYACMVDLLGRCGKLEEAEELVMTSVAFKANSTVWLSLLGACAMHSNLDVAERAAKRIFALDPSCSTAYVLLSNAYASANRWSDVSRVRSMMRQNCTAKQPGTSWL